MRETLTNLNSIIPTAGNATRLYPHTLFQQKAMLPMGSPDKRVVDSAIDIAQQTNETYMTLHWDEEYTKPLLGHIATRNSEITTFRDRHIMGAASLIEFSDELFENDIEKDTIILPADHIIEGLDVEDFYLTHKNLGDDVTILLVPPKDYGQYVGVSENIAVDISTDRSSFTLSSSGIYIIRNKAMLEWAAMEKKQGWAGETRSMLQDFITPNAYKGQASVYKLHESGYWDDVGTLRRYYLNNMRLSGGENVIDNNVEISSNAKIRRSIVLGGVAVTDLYRINKEIVSQNDNILYRTRIES